MTCTLLFIVLVIFLSLELSLCQNDPPKVTVEQGELEGLVLQSRDGRDYLAFLGVPYAKRPERFEIAEFPDKWDGVKEAKVYGNICPQYDNGPVGDEDCLFLNIMTPKLDGNLPVLVYIHGGGFKFTSGDGFGGKYWMDADVVLVTINYRVAALGFLSTSDDILQGNYGMKDQVLSLKWVQQNIRSFGGDPDRVTIFGESAGGASVNYHLISSMSNGLFKVAISQSGAAINPWAFQFNPSGQAEKLAGFLDCPITNSTTIKSCLKLKSSNDIANAISQFEVWNAHPLYPFAPSVENVNDGNADSVFLSDNPFRLMSEGRVNKNLTWVTGVNEAEGIFYVGSVTNAEGFPEDIFERRKDLFPSIFFYRDSVPTASQNDITEKIWKNYFVASETISVANMSNLFGDRFFNFGVREAAKLYAPHGTVYPYFFTKRGFTWGDKFFGSNDLSGATHCDELNWQFNLTFGEGFDAPEFPPNSEDETFSKQFINLWTSIAANGNPTSTWGPVLEWQPIDPSQKTITWYNIDSTTSLKDDPFGSRVEFWEQLNMDEWKIEDGDSTTVSNNGSRVSKTIFLVITYIALLLY